MAVWTTCRNCQKSFSAQEEYLGKKVKCPACGEKVEVLDAEALRTAAEHDREVKVWQGEQEKRIELLEKLSRRERTSLAEEFGISTSRVRNFNPAAVSRFRKLRALSRFMLLGAYLFLPLILAGAVISVHRYRQSADFDPVILALMVIGWLLLLVFSFSLFKFLGEMSWLLADLGDHQLDARNLLLDVREEVDRIALEKQKQVQQ